MRRLLFATGILLLVTGAGLSPALAGQLEKGNIEFVFSFGYQDLSYDDDAGDETTTALDVSFGYLLTDGHELGGVLSYWKIEVDNDSRDSTQFGVFYHYNFRAGDSLNPYVGAFYTFISGDQGDVVDSGYGLVGGVKVYPWDNGGFNFGVRWKQINGADDYPDADGFDVLAGVQLKF